MYNAELETAIDGAVKRWKGVDKKKMFGGVCWLLRGHMCFGIWNDSLIVRMDKEQGAKSLKDRNVKPFDITGRPMAGWVMVEKAGWKSAAGLVRWITIGKEYARSLPENTAKAKKKTLREYNR